VPMPSTASSENAGAFRFGPFRQIGTRMAALLGLRPFTPHDLRRTAATLAGDLGFDDAWIAKCLDHPANKKQEQIVPSVTGKVYNHSKRMKEKRAVLDGVAAELRRIIGSPAKAELRLVA
jgi:integrase